MDAFHNYLSQATTQYGICSLPHNSESFISMLVWTWPNSFSQKLLCCWYSPILFLQHFQPLAASCLKEGSWTVEAPLDLLLQDHWTQSLSSHTFRHGQGQPLQGFSQLSVLLLSAMYMCIKAQEEEKKAYFLLTEKCAEQKTCWNDVGKKLDSQYTGVPKMSVTLRHLLKQSSPAPRNFTFLISL